MKKTLRKKKPISAEQIAQMADRGEDVTRYFTGGKMMNPIQRVNVDFTAEMLEELDQEAAGLNISRQAVIKTLVRPAARLAPVAAERKANNSGLLPRGKILDSDKDSFLGGTI